jgi:hypothetical protein
MGKRLRLLCTALWIFAFAIAAFAQETTGGVRGTVKDPQGAVVSGATVTVTGPALIGKRTVTTDSGGNYKFDQLPPGTYEISVMAQGFGTQTQQGLKIATGALPTINFDMKVGTENQTVEVNDEAVAVDVTQSKVQTNVSQELLQAMPKGRSFQSVIPFAPGARQEPLQGGTSSRTNGFQIDGASDSENVYMIDGVNTTNIQNGGVGKNFQQDFIQEVQIKSSSFEAEYGGALGGVINAVGKRGSNKWHGEVKAYWQSSAFNANDPCASGWTSTGVGTFAGYSTVCGLELDPHTALNTTARQDGDPRYFVPKKDNHRDIEPGFDLSGPIWTDRIWLFTSYIPTIETIERNTTFVGAFNNFVPDPRTLTQSFIQHNWYTRLDAKVANSLRVYGAWNYAYSRTRGQLGSPDSAVGQVRAVGALLGVQQYANGFSTDPSTLRSDLGTVNPLSVYNFGGDWTPTSKLLVSLKYGYFFNNQETRGTPQGVRYVFDNGLSSSTKDLQGNTIPSSAPVTGGTYNSSGFSNIPSTFATQFDAFKRKSWNADASYFVGNLWGSHTFKGGYFWSSQSNDVLKTTNGPWVDLNWGTDYQVQTVSSACDAIIAANVAAGKPAKCQGQYGYFYTGTTTTSNDGTATAVDQALYFQDSWTVGRTGLTINAGIRLDHENNPAFDKTKFPDINFGWGDKIAPRIGGAYDVLHNGKVKAYASYGKFFDIMKLGLTRGSFGSDYWHNCVYALDTVDYKTIVPTMNDKGGCPATGGAPGVSGRFIENVDFRATHDNPLDPAIQTNMKPVQNHEVVAGVDWAITPTLTLETRYSQKRLDNTIEDMAITDSLGFYIGNPGSAFADVLRRPTTVNGVYTTTPFCAECPGDVKAVRKYDGVEFKLTKRGGNRWYGSVTYAYSKLRGNYSGLTDTDPTDGGGGRHSPNNGRAFDLPTMTYLPSGALDNGPLSTDRPNTAKLFGWYRLPWLGQDTWFGVQQAFYQGTPISACIPVVGTSSACQWAEGRGNMPRLSRDPATGNIVKDGVVHDARTAPFFQTDFSLRHEIKVSKAHEGWRLVLEGNAYNLLNQHAPVGYYEFVIPTSAVSPTRVTATGRDIRFTGDPAVNWNALLTGYNYIDALNGTGAFAGNIPSTSTRIASPRTLASRFGMPQIFQTARQFRFAVRWQF